MYMSFFSDQAAQFQKMAAAIQTRLTNEGSTLDATSYESLEAKRDTLLDQADAMIAADVQASLSQLKLDQPRLAACTTNLLDSVKTVKRLDQVLAIVAAGVTLATAIASANPMAIAGALEGAEKAVASAIAKPKVTEMPGDSSDGLAIAASDDSA
jgi:hypothetical protein